MTEKIIPFHQVQEKGLFAVLTDCVLISLACQDKYIRPYFFVESRLATAKGHSRNAITYYFLQPRISSDEALKAYADVLKGNSYTVKSRYDINAFWSGNQSTEVCRRLKSIEDGAKIFRANLRVKSQIIDCARGFWRRNFRPIDKVLAIHYRGSDKIYWESDFVTHSAVLDSVFCLLRQGNFTKVYVATDDSEFLSLAKAQIPVPVISRRHITRTIAHIYDTSDNYRKGLDALIDCLLMSMADHLIKTPSLLSAWCKVFSPSLKTTLIGRPLPGDYIDSRPPTYGYWPESCLHKKKHQLSVFSSGTKEASAKAAILILSHTADINASQIKSLEQCYRILGHHDTYLVCPSGMDTSQYQAIHANLKPYHIDPWWQATYDNFNRLKVSPLLYKAFQAYRYILFYELDAYVFSDQLDAWCSAGYDYIGAPWFKGFSAAGPGSPFIGVGNGGFSLRSTKSALRALRSFSYIWRPQELLKMGSGAPAHLRFLKPPILEPLSSWQDFASFSSMLTIKNNTFFMANDFAHNEDMFWGFFVARNFSWFRVPPPHVAARFSVETLPRYLYERAGFCLPFGCHAWEKHDSVFWSEFIS